MLSGITCTSTGWRRWAIDVGLSGEQFAERYGDWPVVYHGTKLRFVHLILETGFRPSWGAGQCWLQEGEGAVYLSPSIEYPSNPRCVRPSGLEQIPLMEHI